MICEKKEKKLYLSIYKGVRGVGENEIQEHSAYVTMLVYESENPDLLHENMG
jgi:hypothetical protein